MGIVFVKNASDSDIWESLLKSIEDFTGTGFEVSFTIIFLVAVNIPGVALTLMSIWAQKLNGDTWKENLTKFGYALIPLDMAAVIAHTCIDILSNGKALAYTAGSMVGIEAGESSRSIVADSGFITVIQMLLIVGGAVGSAYAVYRIAKLYFDSRGHVWRTIIPYATMITSFAAINIYIYSLPKPEESIAEGITYVAKDFDLTANLTIMGVALLLVTIATVWAGTKKRAKKPQQLIQVSRRNGSSVKTTEKASADLVEAEVEQSA